MKRLLKSRLFIYSLLAFTFLNLSMLAANVSYTQIGIALFQLNASAPTATKEGMLYYNSTDKKFQYHDGTQFQDVGAGGGGDIRSVNFWQDPEAEDGANLAVYDDGGTLTDGTGGTATGMSTSATAATITDTAYICTFGASSTVNEGCSLEADAFDSNDFKIVGGTPVTIQFDYATNNWDNEVSVYIYKIGSNTLEALNGIDNIGNYGNAINDTNLKIGTFTSTTNFSSSDTDFRIIFNKEGAMTGANSLRIDNVFVGYKGTVTAPIVTDWESYTPTFSSSLGTVSAINFIYKRVGDTLHINGQFTTGTVTSGSANFSIPSGLTIDTTIGANEGVNHWRQGGSSTSDFNSGSFTLNSASLTFTDDFSTAVSSGSPTSPANANVIFSNSSEIFVQAEVPIAEWSGNSTNILNSTQIDFSKAILRIGNSKNPSNTIDTSNRTMTFANDSDIEVDTHGIFDRASGDITAPIEAEYEFNIWFEVTPSATTLKPWCRFWVANETQSKISNYITTRLESTGTTDVLYQNGVATISANKGDILTVNSDCAMSATWNAGLMGSGFAVVVKPNLKVIGNAGVPYEVIETDSASTSQTTSANTLTEAFGSSSRVSVTPGTWELVLQGSLVNTNVASNNTYCRVAIYDTSNAALNAPIGRVALSFNGDGAGITEHDDIHISTIVTVTESKTYSAFLESSAASANGHCRFASNSWTGGVTNPDADVILRARRLK